jgi:hypothetical protein
MRPPFQSRGGNLFLSIRWRRLERRRAQTVMLATVIVGLWSLMSGTVVVMALEAVIGA